MNPLSRMACATLLAALLTAASGIVLVHPASAQGEPLTGAGATLYLSQIVQQSPLGASAAPAQNKSGALYLPSVAATDAAPPAAAWITPAQGGAVTSAEGRFTLTVPPGAVTGRTWVTLQAADVLPPADRADLGLTLAIDAVDDTGRAVTGLAKAATLRVRYQAADVVALDVDGLTLHAESATPGVWETLPSQIDPAAATVSAPVTHFSHFGLFGDALRGSIGPSPSQILLSGVQDMAVDNAGVLYFTRRFLGEAFIYRRPPASDRAVLFYHFDVRGVLGGPMHAPWLPLAVVPESGALYVGVTPANGLRGVLVRVEPHQGDNPTSRFTQVYPPPAQTSTCSPLVRVQIAPVDRSIWVQCGEGFQAKLVQLHGTHHDVLQTVALPDGVFRLQDWTVDAAGRLFAHTDPNPNLGRTTLGIVHRYDAQAQTWQPLAEGIGGIYGSMAADAQGNVFLLHSDHSEWTSPGADANKELTHHILVIQGDAPVTRSAIRWSGLDRPYALALGAGKLVVSTMNYDLDDGSRGALLVFPAARRLDAHQSVRQLALETATVSGRGGLVALLGADTQVPANAGLWIGGQRLRLAGFDATRLTFELPLGLAPGTVRAQSGGTSQTLAALDHPEAGNWKAWNARTSSGDNCFGDAQTPLPLAVGEWGLWNTAHDAVGGKVATVESLDGLFAPWAADEQGRWLAYRFERPGDYDFQVTNTNGTVYACKMNVSYTGAASWNSQYTVDPAQGGVFYNNGARLEIPAGALPGTTPVALFMSTYAAPSPLVEGYQPEPSDHYQHKFSFSPEPDRLLKEIGLRLRYDPAAPERMPLPAYHDDGSCDAADAYCMSTYVPAFHARDETQGLVTLRLLPGAYGPTAAPASADRPVSQSAPTNADNLYFGEQINSGLNKIGSYVWWKVGMPNEAVLGDHFSVLYNSRGGVTRDKAEAAYEGLVKARNRFRVAGYTVPDWVVVTLDPKLAAEGSVSGLGEVTHWKMKLAGWMVHEHLYSAAAHELFHIIQYENMSYAARTRKFQWNWFMEGSAVWAETVISPDNNTAAEFIRDGADFATVGLDNYNGMSTAQAYGAAALFVYLEQEHPGAILAMLQAVGLLTDPADALADAVGDLDAFYAGFAAAYFGQATEPYKAWDLRLALPTTVLDAPQVVVISGWPAAYSVRAAQVVAGTGAAAPVSFSQASGSVLRAHRSNVGSRTLTWLPAGTEGPGLIHIYPEVGVPLDLAATFTPAQPLKVVHVNGAHTDESTRILLEVPTLTEVTPGTFKARAATTLTLRGGGFGAEKGTVALNVNWDYTPAIWSETEARLGLAAETVTPGDVSVQVVHAAGVRSNVRTVQAVP